MPNESKIQVVIVEDNASIRMLYDGAFNQANFKDERYDVILFPRAEEALDHYKKNAERVAVIISDFELGPNNMNGGAFLRKVALESAKYDPPLAPFKIIASTHADSLQERDARVTDAGLAKPLRPSVLIQGVNLAIDRFLVNRN